MTEVPQERWRRRGRAARVWATRVFAVVGLAATVLLAVGLVADVRAADRTTGGYEAPYTGWTGTPIDYASQERSQNGFVQRGHVSATFTDCGTGRVTARLFGVLPIWSQQLSDRAIAVHRPREACSATGFAVGF